MTGPLAGVKVLDFGQIVSAPMAGMWLGDQGAEVIKVEGPEGDPLASLGPAKAGLGAMYAAVNRGKTLEVIDLSDEANRPRLEALIAWADVLIQNFRPGVAARLGLGWARAQEINDRLIYVSISGFGDDGPYAGQRVYDMAVQAISGLAGAQTLASGGKPTLMAGIVADKVTALTAAQAATAALFERETSGRGQHVECVMLDSALAFHWPDGMWNQSFIEDEKGGASAFPEYAMLNKPLPAKDGAVIIGAMQYKEAQALARAIGEDDLLNDARFSDLKRWRENGKPFWRLLAARIAEMPVAELRKGFLREDAVGAVIANAGDIADDPQVRHRSLILTLDEPGVGSVYAPRHPPRFSRTPAHAPRPAPRRL
ncbi:CoA transferase [Pacificimonas sp. WHA3]|uniref:CoA transferase n=1 Tax=Pacificimonas pallii TaxID=2827236 RepID=A0ABS6SHI2_9SPHN|nr:CoA transferase [Pacificimonas pallii]MBV7257872.1 CoA transferase [Pacificimonas pallii]